MPIIHARVPEDVAEYVDEWADAVGAPVEDIAGDCITRTVEDADDVDHRADDHVPDPPSVTVDDLFADEREHTADDNDRLTDTDDEADVATLHHYRRQVPASWCVTLRIPRVTDTARKAYAGHPIFHAAVDVVARTAVGDAGTVDREDIDGILRREHGTTFDIPISLLSGVGHDPEDTAEQIEDALAAIVDDRGR